jgi:hypothetical protein
VKLDHAVRLFVTAMLLAQGGCVTAQRGGEVLSMSDSGHDLPHRPLHEIDIQGHQPGPASGDYCPGQISYFEPDSGLFLTCMGARTGSAIRPPP